MLCAPRSLACHPIKIVVACPDQLVAHLPVSTPRCLPACLPGVLTLPPDADRPPSRAGLLRQAHRLWPVCLAGPRRHPPVQLLQGHGELGSKPAGPYLAECARVKVAPHRTSPHTCQVPGLCSPACPAPHEHALRPTRRMSRSGAAAPLPLGPLTHQSAVRGVTNTPTCTHYCPARCSRSTWPLKWRGTGPCPGRLTCGALVSLHGARA
jgi:hypothetical protein